MRSHPALEAHGITKLFGEVAANRRVDFDLRKGEIHVLLGENGAGKSTLMNIICGLTTPDEGEIYVDGRKACIRCPHDAIHLGIGMVHQHFMLVPRFTVTENVSLGAELTRGPVLNCKKAARHVRELSSEYGLEVNPDAVVEDLSVGAQQRVEIIKTLYRRSQILVLDEPTAVLTPVEAQDLFGVMRRLSERGVSIIFITHKLKEVLSVADRISVMRHGRMIASSLPSETDERTLARLMIGQDVPMGIAKGPLRPGEVVLEVDNLRVHDDRKIPAVREVSFTVRAGEVFGLAGVQGNGQTELVEALCGLRKAESGRVRIAGETRPLLTPRNIVDAGVAHIPEDRIRHGLVLQYTIADNQVLNTYYQQPFAKKLVRDPVAVFENSRRLIDRFDIRASGPQTVVATLSGGNLQKVIVSRELNRDICLLIANQPTRGLDVGSSEYVRRQILNLRRRGVGVLLVSVELDEILLLADRIGVMYRGEMVATTPANQVTRDDLGALMAGASGAR